MITPSFSLTATERILPRLALDFTTAVLDPRVTFTRSTTGTRVNSTGLIESVAINTPRFDYNPTTLAPLGLLVEESRTNLLLNSLINGTNLATQTVTVSATAHTLSFYGTGTVTLSGVSTAGPLVGTGTYPNRVVLTFTPTAGSLTLTVTGTVQFANLEVGAFATSYIPTAASQVTRTADVATMTGTNFSDWYNQSQGAIYTQADTYNLTASSRGIWAIGNPALGFGSGEMMYALYNASASGQISFSSFDNGVQQASITPAVTPVVNVPIRSVFAYGAANYAASVSASTATSGGGSVPTPTSMSIGSLVSGWNGASQYLNGHVQQLNYYPQRIINAEVQAFSK